jgi:hypothetical protein
MSKCLERDPIHLRTAKRGKLRRVEHQRLDVNEPTNHLLLTPALVLNDQLAHRQKLHCFFRKQQQPSFVFSGLPAPGDQSSGSFRAIHTAHPDDSIRGFPLRSITPIRPFRRGVRSTSSVAKHAPELSYLADVRERRELGQQKNLSEIITHRPPSLVENEEFEEFFKYKESPTSREGERRLAGSRIEPFKKYHIREAFRGTLSHRSQLAQ